MQQLHGSRAGGFQNWALAEAPHTFVLKCCNSYTGRGRHRFKIGLSLRHRAHSFKKSATVTRIEGGSFSKWGSRLGAADIRLQSLQQLHGWWAGGFQNGAFAAEGHAESRRPADGRGEFCTYVRTVCVYVRTALYVRTILYVRAHRFVRTYVSASWFQKQAEGQVPEAIINNLGLSPWRRAHPS